MAAKQVRKAVIAAAGFGTRFLPQTKAMPKEMLPLNGKPIIQHIVEELSQAGITDIVIVTGYHKRTVEDHFDDISADLRDNLEQAGKTRLLEETRNISTLANFAYIRQKGPYGNATPILNAAHLIGDEPFIYTFADDFVHSSPIRFKQLIDTYQQYGGSILTCVTRDNDDDYSRYAYVDGSRVSENIVDIKSVIEKPGTRDKAPSSMASVGGYLFDSVLLDYLQKQMETYEESNGEFIMHDALQKMIKDGHHIYGCNIQNGTFYDTGNPLEYLKTVFHFALEDPEISPLLREYLLKELKKSA